MLENKKTKKEREGYLGLFEAVFSHFGGILVSFLDKLGDLDR